MTDSTRVFEPGFQVTNAANVPQSGAILRFYAASTTNTRTVYSDSGLVLPIGVTVTTNSAGRPAASGGSGAEILIFTGTTPYKVTAETNANVLLWSFDNITGALDTSAFLTGTAPTSTPIISKTTNYTILTTDQGKEINANPTGGTFTLTLPSAVTAGNGWQVTVKHVGTANSVILSGIGGQTIDGQTTQTLSFKNQAITVVSDAANWYISTNALELIPSTPQGYLTLTSLTPVISADVTAATSVFYTPWSGNIITIYDGTRFVSNVFSELTLSLAAQHLASQIYDVFIYLSASGVVTIGTGPAWTTATAGSGARGTGAGTTELTRLNGLFVNNVSMTVRNGATTAAVAAQRGTYVGSIFMDGTNGQISCHRTFGQSRKWGVWNAYGRQRLELLVGDPTASWTYATGAFRISNNAATNSGTLFVGLPEEFAELEFSQNIFLNSDSSDITKIAIGVNATTSSGVEARASATVAGATAMGSYDANLLARHLFLPAIGIHTINCLEYGDTNTSTFRGTNTNMLLSVEWRG